MQNKGMVKKKWGRADCPVKYFVSLPAKSRFYYSSCSSKASLQFRSKPEPTLQTHVLFPLKRIHEMPKTKQITRAISRTTPILTFLWKLSAKQLKRDGFQPLGFFSKHHTTLLGEDQKGIFVTALTSLRQILTINNTPATLRMPKAPVADKGWCWSGQKQPPQKSVGYAVVEASNCVTDTGLSVIVDTTMCVQK